MSHSRKRGGVTVWDSDVIQLRVPGPHLPLQCARKATPGVLVGTPDANIRESDTILALGEGKGIHKGFHLGKKKG